MTTRTAPADAITPAPPVPPPQAQPDQLVPPVQPGHQPPLNWSHFKPKFTGKLKEDAEAHLLCTNDLMDTHNFPDNVKIQRFWLTLIGEARCSMNH